MEDDDYTGGDQEFRGGDGGIPEDQATWANDNEREEDDGDDGDDGDDDEDDTGGDDNGDGNDDDGDGNDDDDDDDNNTTVQDTEADNDNDGATISNASMILHATPTLASLSAEDKIHTVREIGHEAVWSLSTAKPGNGVTQIRDESPDTYWQSDGPQPHLINIQFSKRKAVCEVAFYLDFTLDESYTPKRIGIKAGVTHHDLEEVKVVELNEPVGWVSVPLYASCDPLDDDDDDDEGDGNEHGDHNLDSINEAKEMEERRRRKRKPLRTFLLQICILSMHQNGRDNHVRQVKIFGPRAAGDRSEIRTLSQSTYGGLGLGLPRFQTVEMSQFSTIR